MGLLATLFLNAALALAGYWTARHAFRQPPGLTRGLAAVTLAWTWATVGMLLLGALGWLALGPLCVWTGFGLLISGLLRRRDSHRSEAGTAPADEQSWGWAGVAAVGLLIWGAVTIGVPSLFLPVKVVSDGPIYHLYFAARWWKEGKLSLIAAPFGENAATYFPAVGDLWFTWLMAGWGSDRLAKIGQAPFLLTAALAAFAMARRLGARCSASVIAATWFAASSPLLLFSFEPNVDTIFAAGYLLAAFFFFVYAREDGRGATLALGGLAAGGALGTKAIGIVFVPILLALAALAVLRNRGASSKGRHLLVLMATPLVMAGFWYGRNLWLTGNPLYPLHVTFFGRVLLTGWYDSSVMASSPYYLPVRDWRSLADTLLAVLDPRLAVFWGIALLGGWAWGRTRESCSSWVWGCSLLAALNVALYWVLIPYRTQQRFMLHAIGLAVVPLARFLDRGQLLRAAAVFLLAAHLTTSQGWPIADKDLPWDLSPLIPNSMPGLIPLPAMIAQLQAAVGGVPRNPSVGPGGGALGTALSTLAIGVGSFLVAWLWSRVRFSQLRTRGLAAVAGSAGLLLGSWVLLIPMNADARLLFFPPFRDYYMGWLDLDLRAGSSGTRIAYSGTDLPFYLLGAGLRNEVRYINIDSHRDWLLHDYHHEARARGEGTWPNSRPGWDRIHPDYAAWLENLRAEGIRLLVVARANPAEGVHNVADAESFPIERVWADTHPETFEPVYGVAEHDPKLRIYRLRSVPRNP